MVLEGYAFGHLDHLAANLTGTLDAITIRIFKIKILVVRHIDDENGIDILGDRHPAGGPHGSRYLIRLTVQPGSLKETPEGRNSQSDTQAKNGKDHDEFDKSESRFFVCHYY